MLRSIIGSVLTMWKFVVFVTAHRGSGLDAGCWGLIVRD
jgi:hypothetical protein